MMLLLRVLFALTLRPSFSTAFSVLAPLQAHGIADRRSRSKTLGSRAPQSGEEEEDEKDTVNPYADPNYPDLEFVNYDDPEYVVDQGVDDELSGVSSRNKDSTEEEIEEMREGRRKKNDEFQFQTYFRDVLRNGEAEFKGEWTVYQSGRFRSEESKQEAASGPPELFQATKEPLTVVSRGSKEIEGKDTSEYDIEAERLLHSEQIEQASLMGDDGIAAFEASVDSGEKTAARIDWEKDIVGKLYWPEALKARDFRGEQGIMVCGNSYTICTAHPLKIQEEQHNPVGPFSEYRAEVGIIASGMRFRVKLDYRTLDFSIPTPPLHLKSLAICRETLDMWPRSPGADKMITSSLFRAKGASGGLYDPPPIKTEEQANKYLLMELEGGASLLFPYEMDQDPSAFDGEGWVTSLDWTAGNMRYQVDRKVNGGPNLLGLKTLELSEVQGADAETYRPRDGGQDMRQ